MDDGREGASGRKSVEFEKLLKIMEMTHTLHIQHVAMLRRDLERSDYAPPTPYHRRRPSPPPKPEP